MGSGASTATGASDESLSLDLTQSNEQIARQLAPLYESHKERFQDILHLLKTATRNTRPAFRRINVKDVPVADLETLKKTQVSKVYVPADSEEAQERVKKSRQIQFKRWNWATQNIDTYINVLRAAGHDDVKIQDMLDGTPLCFSSPAAYADLRRSLTALAPLIEAEMNWDSCGFVITGSSVPGFSQNPCKGLRDLPSKITDPSKSDVDICIVADGVHDTVAHRLAVDENAEPRKTFSTTCTPHLAGVRYGCKDLSKFCKAVAEFHAVWSTKLPGGLQITFAEDDNDTPPWEARIPFVNDDEAGAETPAEAAEPAAATH